jgi:hypothetical protein
VKQVHAGLTYRSQLESDNREGWTALALYKGDETLPVMRVIFWDAAGQFVVESIAGEIPLAIVEALIEEAKTQIKIR